MPAVLAMMTPFKSIRPPQSIKQPLHPPQPTELTQSMINKHLMRARFTMHNLYNVAKKGCSSCGK
jgi:hypothetical protein